MQMIVPGCNDCKEYNLGILYAETTEDVDFAYELECDLATHNETHSAEDNARRLSWTTILERKA
jgi:hypothetical protein